MSRSLSSLRAGLLGLAFVGAMGFGVTQAFAGPAAPATRFACSQIGTYFDNTCDASCISRGYDFGFCSNGVCTCRKLTPP